MSRQQTLFELEPIVKQNVINPTVELEVGDIVLRNVIGKKTIQVRTFKEK